VKKALLDTNILSYFLRGETQVVKKFREYQQFHSYLTFSVLTYYEIKSGLLYKDAKNLLQQFEILANGKKWFGNSTTRLGIFQFSSRCASRYV